MSFFSRAQAEAPNGVVADIARVGERSIGRYLQDFLRRGILEKSNGRAWTTVRHAVMHGNLVPPWATEEEDQRLLDLSDLVYHLTRELIRQCDSTIENAPHPA